MKKIFRNSEGRVVAGVCRGFADFLSVEVSVVRAVWVVFTLFGGSGILAYLLGILFIPEAPSKRKEDSHNNTDNTAWYLVLIAVAIFTLIRYDNVFAILWEAFWGSGFNVLTAIILLVFGVYFFGKKKEDEEDSTAKDIKNKLHLSVSDKKILGVCGGVGETFDIDVNLVRYLWVLGTFMSAGIGILVYLVLGMMLQKTEIQGDAD